MGQGTSIEWTEVTWNPTTGCTRTSSARSTSITPVSPCPMPPSDLVVFETTDAPEPTRRIHGSEDSGMEV